MSSVIANIMAVSNSYVSAVPKEYLFKTAYGIIAVFGFVCILDFFLSPNYSYKGKHVLVTGGSSGIGLEIARECLKKGARVTIVARDKTRLSDAVANLRTSTSLPADRVQAVSVDTSGDAKTVNDALSSATKEFGDVDVLINCAGTSIAAGFDSLTSADFERMYKINVLGSVLPTQSVLEGMKKKRSGRIIFVSSQVAQAAIHGYTAYAASKWALRGLAEALQMEVKPYGIYVSVAYPPDTDTPGYKLEMESKPNITKLLSESGAVFKPDDVARDILDDSAKGYFGLSNGLDGWLLKQLHPGMTPANNVIEVVTSCLFTPLCRFIALFYILSWDSLVKKHTSLDTTATASTRSSTTDSIKEHKKTK